MKKEIELPKTKIKREGVFSLPTSNNEQLADTTTTTDTTSIITTSTTHLI